VAVAVAPTSPKQVEETQQNYKTPSGKSLNWWRNKYK